MFLKKNNSESQQKHQKFFAPLAYRLGMGILNRKLEDLSFPFVYPKEHERVQEIMKEKNNDDVELLKKLARLL